jgi:hypothetical protein
MKSVTVCSRCGHRAVTRLREACGLSHKFFLEGCVSGINLLGDVKSTASGFVANNPAGAAPGGSPAAPACPPTSGSDRVETTGQHWGKAVGSTLGEIAGGAIGGLLGAVGGGVMDPLGGEIPGGIIGGIIGKGLGETAGGALGSTLGGQLETMLGNAGKAPN